jgi:hypothetical protein
MVEASTASDMSLLLLPPDTSLRHFLAHGGLNRRPDAWIDLSELGDLYRKHCETHEMPVDATVFDSRGSHLYNHKPLLVREFYADAFADGGLRVVAARKVADDDVLLAVEDTYKHDLQLFDVQSKQDHKELLKELSRFEVEYGAADAEYSRMKEGATPLKNRISDKGWWIKWTARPSNENEGEEAEEDADDGSPIDWSQMVKQYCECARCPCPLFVCVRPALHCLH